MLSLTNLCSLQGDAADADETGPEAAAVVKDEAQIAEYEARMKSLFPRLKVTVVALLTPTPPNHATFSIGLQIIDSFPRADCGLQPHGSVLSIVDCAFAISYRRRTADGRCRK